MVRRSAMSSLNEQHGAGMAPDAGTMRTRAGMLARIVPGILRAEACDGEASASTQ